MNPDLAFRPSSTQRSHPLSHLSPPPQPVGALKFILLFIVTFGIYGLYRFYVAGKVYEQMSGERSKFRALFWTYLAFGFFLSVLGQLSVLGGSGLTPEGAMIILAIFGIPTLVGLGLGAWLLAEILRQRDLAVERVWGSLPGLTSKSALVTLWILGALLVAFGVGYLLLLVQAILFFGDYNRIVRAVHST